MATGERKHLISVHTSTGTEAPSGASLVLGEIAVQHTPDNPALWIKMGTSEASDVYEKFIGETEIMTLISNGNILGSGYTYSGIPYVNSSTTIADAYSALTQEVLDDEETISRALNDLNDRVDVVEDDYLTSDDLTGITSDISGIRTSLSGLSGSVVSNAADIYELQVSSATQTDMDALSAQTVTNTNDIAELSAATSEKEIFWVTMGETPYAEIISAYNENKFIVIDADGGRIPLVAIDDEEHVAIFTAAVSAVVATITVDGNNNWDSKAINLNEIEDLSAATLDIQQTVRDNSFVTAQALNALNEDMIELSGRTTDLSNYYTKAETDELIEENKSPFIAGDGENSAVLKESGNMALGSYSVAAGISATTIGDASHAEGGNVVAIGAISHIEGASSTNALERGITSASTASEIFTEWASSNPESAKFALAYGDYSHVEGNNGIALGKNSHAEGNGTAAYGHSAHAEGTGARALRDYAHAEGLESIAYGKQSHAEGEQTVASGESSHSEGRQTSALTQYSHAEGYLTNASGESSHAEGRSTTAKGNRSHAEGMGTQAIGNQAHAEGNDTIARAWASHTEGYNTEVGGTWTANTKTEDTDDNPGDTSHAEGNATIAKGPSSHSEGIKTFAFAKASHAEGVRTSARGDGSHAEGGETTAYGMASHAEGASTNAYGEFSHTEGYDVTASGTGAHAEGIQTLAYADGTHAEGVSSKSYGDASHAEGSDTTASGSCSHTEGRGTTALNMAEHAEGQYNVSRTGSTAAERTTHTIGIGTSSASTQNALEIMQNGDVYLIGIGGYSGTSITDVDTLQEVLGQFAHKAATTSIHLESTDSSTDVFIGPYRDDKANYLFTLENGNEPPTYMGLITDLPAGGDAYDLKGNIPQEIRYDKVICTNGDCYARINYHNIPSYNFTTTVTVTDILGNDVQILGSDTGLSVSQTLPGHFAKGSIGGDIAGLSAATISLSSATVDIQQYIVNSAITKNDLIMSKGEFSANTDSGKVVDAKVMYDILEENENVIALALLDMNDRVDVMSGNVNTKQDTLVSGTNIKTINNQSLLGSGNITISADTDTFIAEYGVTTIAQIKTAYDAGKMVSVHYTDSVNGVVVTIPLAVYTEQGGQTMVIFQGVYNMGMIAITITSTGGWQQPVLMPMVTNITSASTNTEIPTAAAVYGIVGDIETLLSQI